MAQIVLPEGASPSTPATGNVSLYAKADGKLYFKDDAGLETGPLGAGGGGSGITTLNSQTGTTQTFANDTNVTITSATNTHTLGWSGSLAISRGGTGQTTANAALNALLPSQATNNGKVLTTDGTNTSWTTVGGTGTVTSVGLTMPTGFSVSGSPVTASGTLAVTTSLSGVIKGNGSGLVAATAGTDYVAPGTATTFTATQTPDNGTASVSTTSTYTFDGADQIREITLTNAITVTFGAPSGITPYAMYVFMLKAGDTSARTFAWNAAYKFPSASPTVSSGTTTSGAYDILTFIGGASNTLIFVGAQSDVR